MRELKWNWVYYPYLDAPNNQEESALKAGYIKVVSKDEVDKVIAELEERIADGDKDFEMANHQNERLLKIVRHHKYRRCLAMARWCASRSASWCLDPADEQLHKSDFYDKWKKRWLELAKKFKE